MTGGEVLTQSTIILLLLVANGLMVASEIALVSASRPHLIRKAEQDPDAAAALRLLGTPTRFLATIQVGITVTGLFASAVGTLSFHQALSDLLQRSDMDFLSHNADTVSLVTVTLMISFVTVVVGELVPKQVGIRYADRITLFVARPVEWMEVAAGPLVWMLNTSATGLLKVIGLGRVSEASEKPSVTEADLRVMFDVAATEGDVEEREVRMLHRVFELTDRLAREVMTPRPEMIWFDKDATIGDFLPVYVETYHSRYPVCDGEPDAVLGVFSTKDVLREMANGNARPERLLNDLLHEAYFVPETKRVGDLFEDMRTSGEPVAFVVDEYGGIAGLITLKSLVEEIVGPVTDDLTPDTPEWEQIDEHTVRVEGSMRIDEANETLELNLPEGEYETIAGFVLHQLGRIPKPGDQVALDGKRLVVSEMDGVKVDHIDIIRNPLEPSTAE